MVDDEGALVVCLDVLRWSGLSFTKVRRTAVGDLEAKDSVLHLVVNVAVAGVFLFGFFRVDLNAYTRAGEAYKSSAVVYPLYTKLMTLTVVIFSLCGNVYNRRFVDLMNLFRRVGRDLEPLSEGFARGKSQKGRKILFGFLAYAGASTGLGLWVDTRLTVRYNRTFRIVHYFCLYYVTLFTAHFVITMNHAKENFRLANAVFAGIVRPKRRPQMASPFLVNRIRRWITVYLDLRKVEELANEVFGKQIFLIFVLAFSSICVNAYYFITLNLYGTSYLWLNLTMWIGFLQSVMVAFVSTRAAELVVKEANKVNEVILGFPFHLDNWRTYNLIKYFAFLTYYRPLKFNAWIFYAVDYDSLFKVILTSSAITALILQCDFLRENFSVQHNGTTHNSPNSSYP